MRRLTLIAWFAIAGFIAGEVYMCYTVLAPVQHAEEDFVALLRAFSINFTLYAPLFHAAPPTLGAIAKKLFAMSIFFGPFGAAAGTGIGLLVQGLIQSLRRPKAGFTEP